MMQIHKKIEWARKKAGLTQDQLAKKLEIGRSTYQYWEESDPSIEKTKSVARALGLQEDFFFVTPDDFFVEFENGDEGSNQDLTGKTEKGQLVYVEAKDLTASYERIIEEKEARRLETKEWADRLLKIIENNLTALLTNSNTTLDRLSLVETIIRSDDTVIMNNQDRQSGNEVGTSAKEAGSRQIAADKMRKGKGNQAGARK